VILVFRLLSWAEKYETPYPKLFALAGILSALPTLALWIVWALAGHDKSYPKR
jgi:hypothetical protein